MFNPPNPYRDSGSFADLLKRMTLRMQQQKIDDHIREIFQQALEKELEVGSLVLARPERVRLFREAMKVILLDMLGKLEDTK
ncbi:MAG TPA: hypothetical protein PKL78_15045 [Anaerolineales bacterium]|nr:hypothetical protein [Anaerolineales bacterium]HNN14876.1 hypothetical protein [Anaerolineales bacterium]HNO32082.1 hypothetical protein [Anaerolineales bacterium]